MTVFNITASRLLKKVWSTKKKGAWKYEWNKNVSLTVLYYIFYLPQQCFCQKPKPFPNVVIF